MWFSSIELCETKPMRLPMFMPVPLAMQVTAARRDNAEADDRT
jgi:hypothetical protein